MKSRNQSMVLILLLVVGVLSVAGCNTTRGIGEDLEEAGEGIQDATN